MKETLTMTTKEIDTLKVIHNVINKKLTWSQAGETLSLTERQIGRICARVRSQGNPGVIHRLRGKPSNHRLAPGLLDEALSFVKKHYWDFHPTHANEKIRDIHKIVISTPTLRQGMIREGLWKPRKQKVKHCSWRERKPCVGILVQVDGSEHQWFEQRGPKCVLLIFIDDATSQILHGEFVPSEDTPHLLGATKAYLLKHGRPVSFYVDKDSIYRINRQPTVEEQLQDEQPMTQFKRAMNELGIDIIFAHSPQAKGRVERGFNTHQNRLVKELRLAGISSIDQANHFLQKVYIPMHNARRAIAPASPTNAHRKLLKSHILHEILSIRTERTVFNDFTVQFKKQFFQLSKDQPIRVRPKNKVLVEIQLNGSLHIRFKDRYLIFSSIEKRPYRPFHPSIKPSKSALPATPHSNNRKNPFRSFDFRRNAPHASVQYEMAANL